MATKIQWRRGTAAEWTAANPVLSAAEAGVETDTGKFKIGDGVATWDALAYAVDIPEAEAFPVLLIENGADVPADTPSGTLIFEKAV